MKKVSLTTIPVTTTSHNNAGKKQQMIAPGDIPHLVQFAQATLIPGEVVAKHSHNDLYEIFFVESGSGVIRINEEEYTLMKGTCITVEPNEQHEIENTGKAKLKLTYFAVIA